MRVLRKWIINKKLGYRKPIAKINCIFSRTLILISIVCFGYLYLTPYIAIVLLKTSVEKNNSNEAAKYIDFASVRDSLKSQLTISLRDKINSKNNNINPFAEIGISFLQPLAERAINSTLDYTVTPKGLSILIRTGELSNNFNEENNKINNNNSVSDSDYTFKLYYKNLNKFVLTSSSRKSNNIVRTYWHRSRLIHWRLTSIELPRDTLNLNF